MVRYFIVKIKELPKDIINTELQKYNKNADDIISITAIGSEDLIVFYRE